MVEYYIFGTEQTFNNPRQSTVLIQKSTFQLNMCCTCFHFQIGILSTTLATLSIKCIPCPECSVKLQSLFSGDKQRASIYICTRLINTIQPCEYIRRVYNALHVYSLYLKKTNTVSLQRS